MCRDGYREMCREPGCADIVTCRDGLGYCRSHDGFSDWDESDRVGVADQRDVRLLVITESELNALRYS